MQRVSTGGEWVPVGKPTDFKPRTPKKCTLSDGTVIYVTREAAFAYSAVAAQCAHKLLCEWSPPQQQYRCPKGCAFGHDGKVASPATKQPLSSYPVAVKQGQVVVQLKKKG